MKIAFYTYKEYRLENDYLINKMPKSNVYVQLVLELKKIGYKVHTLDVYKKNNIIPDVCIIFDIPPIHIKKIINNKTKTIVLLREADMISKRNYDIKRHKEFDYILTWKRKLVDNKKYFYIPSAKVDIQKKVDVKNYNDRKLCTLINSNLSSSFKGELYSKRLEIIKWFEKNHLKEFDLWGYGWNEYRFKILNRIVFKTKLFAPKRLSYKGMAKDKLETMSKYKFSICFENTCLIDDYISEKIFDSFLAGSVPIYFGAPNIQEHIPKGCFIDFREFKRYEELYDYIKKLDEKSYMRYIVNINSYLLSEQFENFFVTSWKESILNLVKRIVNDE